MTSPCFFPPNEAQTTGHFSNRTSGDATIELPRPCRTACALLGHLPRGSVELEGGVEDDEKPQHGYVCLRVPVSTCLKGEAWRSRKEIRQS